MATSLSSFTTLTDAELLSAVHRLAGCERYVTTALIASLAEVDVRRLYVGEGCSSLFTYCTRVLHLSEHAAYKAGSKRPERRGSSRSFSSGSRRRGTHTDRPAAARAASLTFGNHVALLDAARHRSKHEVERLVATLRPKPDVPATAQAAAPAQPPGRRRVDASAGTRALALASASASAVSPPAPSSGTRTPSSVQPLAPARYNVQVTLGDEGISLLRRAQALIRHRVPDGDMAAVVTEGLKLLVERLEKEKAAATARPPTNPARVRSGRAPFRRWSGVRCGRVTRGAARLPARRDGARRWRSWSSNHVRPYADGGPAVVKNIELRRRAYNQYEAEQYFGDSLPWNARETTGSERWADSFLERVR